MSQITKILFRRGSNFERLSAEGIGVTFSVGEPAWTHDTRRLYVGDDQTVGGYPVGVRNLGAVNQLFGNYGNSGYSQEGYNLLLSGVEIGDILYDRETRILYSLTGRSNFPPPTGELVKYDFTVLLDNDFFYFDSSGAVSLKNESIGPYQVASSLVGGGLTKYTLASPIQIADRGVTNLMLGEMGPNTIKCNNKIVDSSPIDLGVGPKQFVGRTSTSTLTTLDFTTILAEANILTQNGINVQSPNITTTIFSLCSNIFRIAENSANVNILPTTTINAPLSVVGSIQSSGNVSISGDVIARKVYGDSIISRNGTINDGTGILSGGNLFCREINSQGYNIGTNGGDMYCNRLYATGHIIAFYTSDARLKQNLVPLGNSLSKLDDIQAYTFTWIPSTEYKNVSRTGKDIGLVAQEVSNILPEAVSINNDGYYGVDYVRVIPYLVGCIKELKKELQQLKNEIQQISK